MAAHFVFATLVASMAPNAAITEHLTEPATVDVAFEQLQAGDTDAAVRHLEECRDMAANDPSRLINLGSAYARQGRIAEAEDMYRAAIASEQRYRLELADGSWADSRVVARLALSRLHRSTAVALR